MGYSTTSSLSSLFSHFLASKLFLSLFSLSFSTSPIKKNKNKKRTTLHCVLSTLAEQELVHQVFPQPTDGLHVDAIKVRPKSSRHYHFMNMWRVSWADFMIDGELSRTRQKEQSKRWARQQQQHLFSFLLWRRRIPNKDGHDGIRPYLLVLRKAEREREKNWTTFDHLALRESTAEREREKMTPRFSPSRPAEGHSNHGSSRTENRQHVTPPFGGLGWLVV